MKNTSNIRPGTLLRWHALSGILVEEINPGSTIIDIGSFDGFTSVNLLNKIPGVDITVIDLDRAGLNKAKQKGLNTILSSAEKLPIKNDKIDTVICLDLIEHIENDNMVIEEISRVLKKNGKLILTTPMEYGVYFPLLGRKKSEEINWNWGHIRLGYNLNQIKTLFEANNMKIETATGYFNLLTRVAHPFAVNTNILSSIYKWVIRLEPLIKLGSQEHIIIGKKN